MTSQQPCQTGGLMRDRIRHLCQRLGDIRGWVIMGCLDSFFDWDSLDGVYGFMDFRDDDI